MAAKFFGLYLVENGTIAPSTLYDAVALQSRIAKPLCAMSLRKGHYSPAQIADIDRLHGETGRKHLEIAVREKMISFSELQTLYQEKSPKWLTFAEALLALGEVSLGQLDKSMQEYVADREAGDPHVEAMLKGLPESETIASFLKLTIDMFSRYSGQLIKPVAAEARYPEISESVQIFSQPLKGPKSFTFGLAVPETLALPIASSIMGSEQTKMSDIAMDAVCEFVNVVVGHGCVALGDQHLHEVPGVPAVMTAHELIAHSPDAIVSIQMRTTRGDFWILFSFGESS